MCGLQRHGTVLRSFFDDISVWGRDCGCFYLCSLFIALSLLVRKVFTVPESLTKRLLFHTNILLTSETFLSQKGILTAATHQHSDRHDHQHTTQSPTHQPTLHSMQDNHIVTSTYSSRDQIDSHINP